MSDRLRTLHAQADALLSLLAARGLEDLAGAVLPGQNYEARITGGDGDTVTERGVERLDRAATYQTVVRVLERTVGLLKGAHDDVTPTGETCRSKARDETTGRLVECERVAVQRGHCAKCAPHHRQGIPPDAALLAEWNGRLERDCECEASVCTHVPGRCDRRIKPGQQARSCDACRQRVSRARRAEGRSMVGTGGAFGWDEPT